MAKKKTQTTKTATAKGTKAKKATKPTKRTTAEEARSETNEAELGLAEPTAAAPAPEPAAETTTMTEDAPEAPADAAADAAQEPSDCAAGVTPEEERALPLGTVLQKRDRHGMLRCECVVVEGGYRFDGTVYKSLSAAALAAAKSLGLSSKSINGNLFWGLSKPARAAGDPMASLERAWNAYQSRLEATLEKAKAGGDREPAVTTLERHTRVLQNLLAEVA